MVSTCCCASGVRCCIAKRVHHLLQVPPSGLLVGCAGQSSVENAEMPGEPEVGEAKALEKEIPAPGKEI